MNLKILSQGIAREEIIERYRLNPAFRKATRAMMLACASIEAAFESEPLKTLLLKSPETFALVLGSAFGELETTKDFLKTLADTGMARPMLFQNSLHNSTSGFVSIHFKFTGPVLTMSHGLFVAEHAFETANLMLKQNHCDYCVITTVDTFLHELTGAERNSSAEKSGKIETATTFVLTTTERCEKMGLKALGTLEDVRCHRTLESTKPSYSSLFFAGQNTLEVFRDKLLNAKSAAGPTSVKLKIEKPGTCYSVLTWGRS